MCSSAYRLRMDLRALLCMVTASSRGLVVQLWVQNLSSGYLLVPWAEHLGLTCLADWEWDEDPLVSRFLPDPTRACSRTVQLLDPRLFRWLWPTLGWFCASSWAGASGLLLLGPSSCNTWDALWTSGGGPSKPSPTMLLLCWIRRN